MQPELTKLAGSRKKLADEEAARRKKLADEDDKELKKSGIGSLA